MEEKNRQVESKVRKCCALTVEAYASTNPMVMCPGCKHIIKCFLDEKAFNNYVKYCRDRRRNIAVGEVGSFNLVIFRSYESK